ncbi:hypothetical protein LSM04_002968 [Trypanosoma melophagium]|uniref:uncharacterized protein n=1 Tax=Trypanosoma melophagium TaxID=715481 RepID=UPI003519E9A7|nr:hypothetical protein LSM04_002968 [Trypanosoma melophagium]
MPLLRDVSESTVSRYEHMIAQLTTQALSQQEEITQLRQALGEAGTTHNSNHHYIHNERKNNKKRKQQQHISNNHNNNINDNNNNNTNNNNNHDFKDVSERRNDNMCVIFSQETPTVPTAEPTAVLTKSEKRRRGTSRKRKERRMSAAWCRTVEEYTLGLLETYMRRVDERLACSLVERLRRVTREHVMRTVEKEVRRVLHERQLLQQEQEEQLYIHNCNTCIQPHEFRISPEKEGGEKLKSVSRESSIPTCMNYITDTAVSESITVSSEKLLEEKVTSCDGQSTCIEKIQCVTSCAMNSTSEGQNNLFLGSTSVTEPYVSTISADPSSSDSFTSFHRKHDQHLIEFLQQKVSQLEERLCTATVFDQGTINSPPSVEKTSYYAGDGRKTNNSERKNNKNSNNSSSINSINGFHYCCSSGPLSNSSSSNSVCDDIEVLVDVFEGRKPPKEVLRILLGMSD